MSIQETDKTKRSTLFTTLTNTKERGILTQNSGEDWNNPSQCDQLLENLSNGLLKIRIVNEEIEIPIDRKIEALSTLVASPILRKGTEKELNSRIDGLSTRLNEKDGEVEYLKTKQNNEI